MAFDWNGYLQIARHCVAQPEDEGLLRTAISRAYYAAYHAAKSYVEQVARVDVEGQTDSHKVIWDALKTGPGSKPQLWKLGNELKRARLQADYRDEFGSNVAKAARRALDLATQIVSATTR